MSADTTDSIVVGIDGSATARKALEEGIRLAKALGGEIHVVSAFSPTRARVSGAPEGAAQVWQPLPDDQVEAVLAEAETAVRMAGVPVTKHGLRRDPADALLEVADEVGATMIVVGSRGMSGVRRALGSVPNTVSHRARCSVLIVATGDES